MALRQFNIGLRLALAFLVSFRCYAVPDLLDTPQLKLQPVLSPASLTGPPAALAYSTKQNIAKQMILIFDAGSSGTRAYLYGWHLEKGKVLPKVFFAGPPEKPWVLKAPGGLATLVDRLNEVPTYLKPLLVFVKDKLGTQAKIPTYFYATGGVRKLHDSQEKILLKTVADTLRKETFLDVKEVLELSGQEEGTFTWVAVNALAGKFDHSPPAETIGIVELGGASLQIAFVPEKAPEKDRVTLTLGAQTYTLYSHSYDGVGREEAFHRLASAQHLNRCFLGERGAGPGSQLCIQELMDRLALRNVKCHSQCALQDVYQAPLRGEFVGIENFSHVGNEHGEPHPDLKFLEQLGNKVCALSLSDYRKLYPKAPNPHKACFDISFLRSILEGDGRDRGLGFNSAIKYRAVAHIKNQEPSWTYGATLLKILASPH